MMRSWTKSSRGYGTKCSERKRPVSIKLALEQAEAEKRRRLDEKIGRNEAVRVPVIVVGRPCRVAAEKARRIAALRAAGEKREVIFEEERVGDAEPISVVVTGVPRAYRDGIERCENCDCVSAVPAPDPQAYAREPARRLEPPTPPPMQ